ncbi:MAG: hypothetical protein WC876_00365 [Candidatus Thermoplasmatota archaeon]|jgi:hypothetical protein
MPLAALSGLSRPGLILLIATSLLAGCSEPAAVEEPVPAFDVPTTLIATGPAVGPDLNATTGAPPRLIEGEWWRIKVASAEGPVDLLRVVANATAEGYIFGMPHDGWVKEAISNHAPAFGNVGLDLSYATHNEVFVPFKFPLVAGDSWETTFATQPLVATVESADEQTAVVSYSAPESTTDPTNPTSLAFGLMGGLPPMKLTYDARTHEAIRMESGGEVSWEVVEHGFEFRGWVSVPDGMHTAIDYAAFGPDPDHPGPTRTVTVEDHFNRITVMHFVYAITPGVFRVTSTTPAGEQYVTEHVGASGSTMRIFEVSSPGGDWLQEDIGAGGGLTYTMGIAYEQYDILVPQGDRRPTHGHGVDR